MDHTSFGNCELFCDFSDMDRQHKIYGLMLTPLMMVNGLSIMHIQIGRMRTKQKIQLNMEMLLL